jgi:hypothetical protein
MLSRCDFMHDGKDVSICECVWLYGNCGQDSCSFEYYLISDDQHIGIPPVSVNDGTILDETASTTDSTLSTTASMNEAFNSMDI